MKSLETVSTSNLASESLSKKSKSTHSFNWLCNVVAMALLCVALYVGQDSWKSWFSSPDRTLYFVCVLLGLCVALVRSNWHGAPSKLRVWFATILFAVASLFICVGLAISDPLWSGIACGVLFAGWCVGRIRGDSVWHALFLGFMFVVPFAINTLANLGWFEWLESLTITMTSLLADAAGQPHASEDGAILFKQGIANHFSSIGTWDSVVSFFGVSLLCILAFRRSLLSATATVAMPAVVWVAVRSVAWVILSYIAYENETWYPWSFGLELGVFLVGVALVVSLDRFFANVFKPIPFELFNPESPLCSFAWNWLCGLPNLELRIPKQNKISLRWRTRLHLAGKTPSIRTDYQWMKQEFLGLLFHPIGAIGSVIDAVRGWKYSRSWKSFFRNLPSLLLLTSVYVMLVFSLSKRHGGQTQLFSDESLKLCSTQTLETACHQQQEADFCRAIGAAPLKVNEDAVSPISDSTKRYLELLCKRVLSIEPNNYVAKYRLGMVSSLTENAERAELEMQEIVNGKFGDFPQANSWLAKALVIKRGAGKEISLQELLNHLSQASKWKDVDFRLLFLYSRLLEEQGDNLKAVEVVKQAVAIKPEFILDLARLYTRIGDNKGRIAASNQAEDFFLARINFPTEKESDRLSVADARLLTNRPEQAAEILSDGLRQNLGGERTIRQLSEIQRLMYLNTIRKNDDGKIDVDLNLLEEMAATDPANPNVSSEIAKLIPFKVKPTKKLLDVLRSQIGLGIATAPSLLLLGESAYAAGNLEEAQRYWELAIGKDPENFSALNNLAFCLAMLSSSNVERSLELVSKANSISPNNADILDTWGEVLAIANRPKEAVNKFELAIRIDRNRIETHRKLLVAYRALGMSEMAEDKSKVILKIEAANAKKRLQNIEVPNEKLE